MSPKQKGQQRTAQAIPPTETIFSLHDLSFSYDGRRKQLDKINFALWPGENVALNGSNGAGKTTLFRCITGLNKAQAGEIRLGADLINTEKDFYKLRGMVGYALQHADDQLFFPTVLEDLAFGPLNLGFTATQAKERALQSLELVGLNGYEERLSHQLSGGEKRLVALASILAMQPRALLLDEPLTGLDTKAQERISAVIANLNCAKVIIAHDHEFLNSICTRQLLLKEGHLETC